MRQTPSEISQLTFCCAQCVVIAHLEASPRRSIGRVRSLAHAKAACRWCQKRTFIEKFILYFITIAIYELRR